MVSRGRFVRLAPKFSQDAPVAFRPPSYFQSFALWTPGCSCYGSARSLAEEGQRGKGKPRLKGKRKDKKGRKDKDKGNKNVSSLSEFLVMKDQVNVPVQSVRFAQDALTLTWD